MAKTATDRIIERARASRSLSRPVLLRRRGLSIEGRLERLRRMKLHLWRTPKPWWALFDLTPPSLLENASVIRHRLDSAAISLRHLLFGGIKQRWLQATFRRLYLRSGSVLKMRGPTKVPREVLDGFQQRYNTKPVFVSAQKDLVQLTLVIVESNAWRQRRCVSSHG